MLDEKIVYPLPLFNETNCGACKLSTIVVDFNNEQAKFSDGSICALTTLFRVINQISDDLSTYKILHERLKI